MIFLFPLLGRGQIREEVCLPHDAERHASSCLGLNGSTRAGSVWPDSNVFDAAPHAS